MVAERRSNSRTQQKASKSSPKSITRPQPSSLQKKAIDDDEEVIDYAATADGFFSRGDDDEDDDDDDEGNKEDEDEDDEEVDDDEQEEGHGNENAPDEEDDDDDNDNEEEEEDNDDDSEAGEIDEDDDSVEETEVNDDDDEIDATAKAREQQKIANAGNKIVVPGTEEPCTFDLRNLLAMRSYPMDSAQLYNKKGSINKSVATGMQTKHVILPQSTVVNEEYLLQKAVEGCNQLITALWQLPVERSDAGPMVILPTYDESKVPRKLVRWHSYC